MPGENENRCRSPQRRSYFEETGGAASFAGIQWFAMMLFDEHDLECWIILAILSLIMACPLR